MSTRGWKVGKRKALRAIGAHRQGFQLADWLCIIEGCLEVSLISKDKKKLAPEEGGQTPSSVCSRQAPRESKALAGLGRAVGPEPAGLTCCWCGLEGKSEDGKHRRAPATEDAQAEGGLVQDTLHVRRGMLRPGQHRAVGGGGQGQGEVFGRRGQ